MRQVYQGKLARYNNKKRRPKDRNLGLSLPPFSGYYWLLT